MTEESADHPAEPSWRKKIGHTLGAFRVQPAMASTPQTLEALTLAAQHGDVAALDELLGRVQHDVYRLALRMLWHPEDAKEATQEVLVRVATQLSTFEGRSSVRTWVHRVAVRALLNHRRSCAEKETTSFDEFAHELQSGSEEPHASGPELQLLTREVQLGCTQAMLLCLDREHRLAYVLGEVMDFTSEEAASCLEITAVTFRKRLSRARERVEEFTRRHCGLVATQASCRCERRIAAAQQSGIVDPERLLFAKHPVTTLEQGDTEAVVEALTNARDTRSLFRSAPDYAAPDSVLQAIRRAVTAGA